MNHENVKILTYVFLQSGTRVFKTSMSDFGVLFCEQKKSFNFVVQYRKSKNYYVTYINIYKHV